MNSFLVCSFALSMYAQNSAATVTNSTVLRENTISSFSLIFYDFCSLPRSYKKMT